MPSHIILVDDDDVYRCLNVATLESANYIVHAFPDFRGVTELVDSGAPLHLLLVDIVLPQGTPHGIALAGMVHIRRPTVPIMFVTGYAQHSGDLPLGSRLLLKPFSPQDLLAAVATALTTPPSRRVSA